MTDIARPMNAEPLAESNVYEACRQFVWNYALPALPLQNIIHGWQNITSLAAGTDDYAVISLLSGQQHGTTLETLALSADGRQPDKIYLQGLIEIAVQVDFCADSDLACQRARSLAIVTRSSIGVDFFNQFGLSALYAEAVKVLPLPEEAKQVARGYTTTLHLSGWSGVSVHFETFAAARMSRVENVDVHHPVKGD